MSSDPINSMLADIQRHLEENEATAREVAKQTIREHLQAGLKLERAPSLLETYSSIVNAVTKDFVSVEGHLPTDSEILIADRAIHHSLTYLRCNRVIEDYIENPASLED